MATLGPGESLALLIGLAFLPPILYVWYVRHAERYHREPIGPLAQAFLWGAIGGTTLALILQGLALGLAGTPDYVGAAEAGTRLVLLTVILAPLTEEFAKALGLRWVKDAHPEPEDGLIYGAAAGFGFAATENLAYQVGTYLEEGLEASLVVAGARIVTASFLHASASAIIGYAMWRRRAGLGAPGIVIQAYFLAVVLHALYNAAVVTIQWIGFLLAGALTIYVASRTIRRIRLLDAARA